MRQRAIAAAAIGVVVAIGGETALAAAPCDQYNPWGPAATMRIVLGPRDFVDEVRDELRSFVATNSLGRVEIALLSASPPGVVRDVSAVPEVSRFSPYYGEALKGVAVAIALHPHTRAARVVLNLRQVCAQYFRNTFLYY